MSTPTKILYRQCSECGHEFEVVVPAWGPTSEWEADGHAPDETGTGWAMWNISHLNNVGGDCGATLTLEEDGTF